MATATVGVARATMATVAVGVARAKATAAVGVTGATMAIVAAGMAGTTMTTDERRGIAPWVHKRQSEPPAQRSI
jgi:hypothetical protein